MCTDGKSENLMLITRLGLLDLTLRSDKARFAEWAVRALDAILAGETPEPPSPALREEMTGETRQVAPEDDPILNLCFATAHNRRAVLALEKRTDVVEASLKDVTASQARLEGRLGVVETRPTTTVNVANLHLGSFRKAFDADVKAYGLQYQPADMDTKQWFRTLNSEANNYIGKPRENWVNRDYPAAAAHLKGEFGLPMTATLELARSQDVGDFFDDAAH